MAEAVRAPNSGPELKRELGFRDLVLFSIAGIIGTRWLAAAAQAGTASVILWLAAAVLFFIPSAFAIGRLSARFPQEGGLYIWARECFGEWHGFLCFWIYWIAVAFWFPSAVMAFSSMAVYALGAGYVALADNHFFIVGVALIAIWIVLGANILGLKTAKWIDNAGAVSAYALFMMLVVLASVALARRGSATPIGFVLHWDWGRLNFWSQMAYALTGLELAPILGGEIVRPKRNLPRSALLVTPLITVFYAVGTLALTILVPADGINPLHGITQAVFAAGSMLEMPWLPRAAAVLVILAALGQLSVIGSSVSRLPFVAGTDRLLPSALALLHPRWRTPYVSIIIFGAISTVFLVLAQLGENLRVAYQTITDLMVIGGFLPFLYIFAAAWKCGGRWSVIAGMGVSLVALICSIIPTNEVKSLWLFEAKLFGVTALIVLSARLVYKSRK
jgi:glutamate:GABA antiporter